MPVVVERVVLELQEEAAVQVEVQQTVEPVEESTAEGQRWSRVETVTSSRVLIHSS